MSVPRINGVQLSDPSAGPLLGSSIGTSATGPLGGQCGLPRRAMPRRHVGPAWSRPKHRANIGRVHDGRARRQRAGIRRTRPGLDRRSRSMITLTALVARGHHEELAMHVRAARRNGLSVDEIREVLLQTAIYCGVPDANTAFRIAQAVLADEETTPEEDDR